LSVGVRPGGGLKGAIVGGRWFGKKPCGSRCRTVSSSRLSHDRLAVFPEFVWAPYTKPCSVPQTLCTDCKSWRATIVDSAGGPVTCKIDRASMRGPIFGGIKRSTFRARRMLISGLPGSPCRSWGGSTVRNTNRGVCGLGPCQSVQDALHRRAQPVTVNLLGV